MCTTVGTYSFWMTDWLSNQTRTTDSHLKRIISTSCYILMVLPPDNGPRHARNV